MDADALYEADVCRLQAELLETVRQVALRAPVWDVLATVGAAYRSLPAGEEIADHLDVQADYLSRKWVWDRPVGKDL